MASLIASGEANGGKGGTIAVTLGAAPASGDVLVAGFAGDGISVSSASNGMSKAGARSNTVESELWYKLCNGTESATTTLTLSAGGAAWMWLARFSGADAFLGSDSAAGSGTSLSAGTVGGANTTIQVALFGINTATGTGSSPGPSGFALDDHGAGGPCYAATYDLDRNASASPTVSWSTSAGWAGVSAAFDLTPSGIAIPVAMAHYRQIQQRQRGA